MVLNEKVLRKHLKSVNALCIRPITIYETRKGHEYLVQTTTAKSLCMHRIWTEIYITPKLMSCYRKPSEGLLFSIKYPKVSRKDKMIIILLTLITSLLAIAFFTIAERKLLAAIQRRKGPDVTGF